MKINGQLLGGPPTEVVVIPRGEMQVVIRAKAVLDFDSFEKLCPMPQAPKKLLPGGEVQVNVEDPEYTKRLQTWAQQKSDWMILQSLSATENLEWETVKVDDPTTWSNYRNELETSFTPAEQAKILEAVMTACGLNQSKIEEATKRFLATQAARA